jgi:class 3 adenylate cyclase
MTAAVPLQEIDRDGPVGFSERKGGGGNGLAVLTKDETAGPERGGRLPSDDRKHDGVLATFDGPGRAIRCACAIRDSVWSLGIEVRAGLHTGEIELLGQDVTGMALQIAARVATRAGAGEVLVSSTVRDIVAGSGIAFEDRGEHELKGVPTSWRLYSVAG